MPYYPEGKELENACKKLRLYSVCAECGGNLAVRYDMDKHREYIICSKNEAHEGIRKTWAEDLKQIRRDISMDSKALMKLGEGGMLARIEQAGFPQALKAEEKAMVAEIALSYGLDPIMNELSIYQGRPYPTVNAWYRKSQETGLFDGMNSRPATKQERQERNAKEGDLLYCVEVWRKGSAHPFVGWGRVRAEETVGDKHLPIVKDPDRMAEKRGEMQGMRKAFSIPMPPRSFEEAIDIYADVPDIGKVDTKTGEVVEGEFTEIKEKPIEGAKPLQEHWCQEHNCAFEKKVRGSSTWYAHKLPDGSWCNELKKKEAQSVAQASIKPSEVPILEPEPIPLPVEDPEAEVKRDPDTIRTINELQKALFEDYRLQPKQQLAELNLDSWPELAISPAEAYKQVAASR